MSGRKRPTPARPRPAEAARPATPKAGLELLRDAARDAGVRPGAEPAPTRRPPRQVDPVAPPPPGPPQSRPQPDTVTVTVDPAVPAQPGRRPGRLEVTRFACGPVEGATPQSLGMTYWVDAGPDHPAGPLTVVFEGQRTDLEGAPGPADRFSVATTFDTVVPGSGRTSLTTRVHEVSVGEWAVRATPVAAGVPVGPTATAAGRTAFGPFVRVSGPGVRLGAWPIMVGLGTVLALITQAALASQREQPSLRVLLLTLLACVTGTLGAKGYYLATHRGTTTGIATVGMSVQGFVLVAIGTLVLGARPLGLGVGELLDITTPGLLYGMTVGRFGCFFGGCCAGRVTASRWALWSSDRRTGARRIPVQLYESAVAALLGTLALLAVVVVEPPAGTVFVGAIAAYTFARQLLFPLRVVPRATSHGRIATLAGSAVVVLGDVVVALAA